MIFLLANTALYVALGVIVLLVFFVIALYNGLVSGRNEVKNAWSQVDVQLKRRYDLIPNLVETAKGYLKHERETLEAVTKARQMAIDAKGVEEHARAENMLTSTLRSLFAVAENYPELKANTTMLQLQEELTTTENRIGFARQSYNDSVLRYNNKVEQFPSNLLAGTFGFDKSEFFELEDAVAREPVKVDFGS
ncbi:MAG: LemA family protein [Planctomycetes bacterium]|nr:LemA family protein [Planctomycetota bacterium]MCB9919541.1 LemA family protein [Planctomycetota bacterium]